MKTIKNSRVVLLLFSVMLIFTACEKEETPEVFNTISGILSAGENVNAEDLNGLKVYLGRFHDSVDFSSITLETTAIDSVGATILNPDGSFSFSGLTTGNYGLVLEDGLIFVGDTALLIQVNGFDQQHINQTIARVTQNNGVVPNFGELYITLKKGVLSSSYTLKKLQCYFDSNLKDSYNVPEFYNNAIESWNFTSISNSHSVTFKLEIWKDNDETKKFTSVKIPYYYSSNASNHGPWEGELIDIAWVPYSSTTTWQFAWPFMKIREIKGHYVLSNHN